MKHIIELPEDLQDLQEDLQDLAWDAPVEALTGLRGLELEAEYVAAGLVKVRCVVRAFPAVFVGSSSSTWTSPLRGAALLRSVFAALLENKEAEDFSPAYNEAAEVAYLKAADVDTALADYVSGYLAAFIQKVASL